MSFFTNIWFISIISGIISGIIVFLITRFAFIRRINREYLQTINNANNELMFCFKSSIAENQFLSKKIVDAVRNSTARKYKISVKGILGFSKIIEDLVKEVMDTSFISEELKQAYCNKLIKSLEKGQEIPTLFVPEMPKVNKSFSASTIVPIIFGTISAFTIIITFVWSDIFHFFKELDMVWALFAILSLIIFLMINETIGYLLRKRRIKIRGKYNILKQ